MILTQNVISDNNLSRAWASASIICHDARGGFISPAVVEINMPESNAAIEDAKLRAVADNCICIPDKPNERIETVAGTIFPLSIWKMTESKGRDEFFRLYKKCTPHLRQCRLNNRGVYFERMISFRGDNDKPQINQLEHVIRTWNDGNHRHSAHQVSIFDPLQDHSDSRQRGFPCLQQIALHAGGSNGADGLTVTAFYAIQTLMEKAYGNYLGLYRLGEFMAKEMGITLRRIICITSVLKFSNGVSKNQFEHEMMRLKSASEN